MTQINRREFIKKTATVSAVTAAGLSASGPSRAEANDAIRVGVVGVKGRGNNHIRAFQGIEGVEVVALCDVDESFLDRRAKDLEERTGRKVEKHTDVRKLLDDKSIDVVSIATPNHWHSLIGIWACQAGKDVYCEKPCSHNIFEGRKLVEAARKYNRIVQHGTQIRSSAAVREAMQLLHDGAIGDVYYAKGLCYKWRNTIGHAKEEPVPEGVHYDLWLGPAPKRPFSRNRFHYQWHWNWDYGNGDIGNQGVHQMDVARWGLGVGLPTRVQSMGGHFMFDDDQQTPNTQIATFEYPGETPQKNKMLVFEVRHWIVNNEAWMGGRVGRKAGVIGNVFLGSEGALVIDGYQSYQFYMGEQREKGPSGKSGGNHYQNFIDALGKRDTKLLHADIEEGHLSAALCHLANAAYRTGRTIHVDPKGERVIDDQEANALLTRHYRDPFVVPMEV